jgi:hypothetical protein
MGGTSGRSPESCCAATASALHANGSIPEAGGEWGVHAIIISSTAVTARTLSLKVGFRVRWTITLASCFQCLALVSHSSIHTSPPSDRVSSPKALIYGSRSHSSSNMKWHFQHNVSTQWLHQSQRDHCSGCNSSHAHSWLLLQSAAAQRSGCCFRQVFVNGPTAQQRYMQLITHPSAFPSPLSHAQGRRDPAGQLLGCV